MKHRPEIRGTEESTESPATTGETGRARIQGRWEAGILLAAVLVRLVWLVEWSASPWNGLYRVDHLMYRNWALDISLGRILSLQPFEQGPLYAYLLGAFYAVVGERDVIWLILQAAVGVHTVWLVMAIGRRLFDVRVARLAGIFCALFGPLLFFEACVMKSILSPWLTTLCCYWLLRFEETKSPKYLAGSSLCIGLACLVRENHILLLIPLALFVATRIAESRKRAARWIVTAAALCFAVTLPATVHNWLVGRELVWVTSGGGEVLYMSWWEGAGGYYSPPPFVRPDPEVEHDDFRREAWLRAGHRLAPGASSRFWSREALKSAVTSPLQSAQALWQKTVVLFNDFEVPDSLNYTVARDRFLLLRVTPSFGWYVGLGMLGIVVSLRRRGSLWLPVSIIAAHVVSVLLIYNFARFRLGMMPLWMLESAVGVVWLYDAWKRSTVSQLAWLIAAAAVAGLTLAAWLPPPDFSAMQFANKEQELTAALAQRQQAIEELANLSAAPNDVAQVREQVQLLVLLKRWQQADRLLARYGENHPPDVELLRVHGFVLAQRRMLSAAVNQLAEAVKLHPQDVALLNNLGRAQWELAKSQRSDSAESSGWRQRARQTWQQALALDDASIAVRHNLAEAYVDAGEFEPALSQLEFILKAQPDYFPLYDLAITAIWHQREQLSPAQAERLAELMTALAQPMIQAVEVTNALLAARAALLAAQRSGNESLIQRSQVQLDMMQRATTTLRQKSAR